MSGPTQALLRVADVRVRFGGLVAVDGVSFDLSEGEVLGLIGPNGAGKTTLFNAVSGLVRVSGGSIRYQARDGSQDLARLNAARRARLGIARTFQDSRLLDGMSVLDQLLSGGYAARGSLLGAVVRSGKHLARERELADRAGEVLEALGLRARAAVSVDLLSAPERRLVDLGRALMMRPRLLLLDEVSAGMPPDDKQRVAGYVLDQVDHHGMTVIFVEHDIGFVRKAARRVIVMTEGTIMADGDPDDVLNRPDVLEAYVGPGSLRALR